MGRLIDADAFEKFIKEKYKDGESTDDIKDQMLFDLSYQPTAYDVSKVVAEIKRKYCKKCRNILGAVGAEEYCKEQKCEIDELCDIVRKGGVEWKLKI